MPLTVREGSLDEVIALYPAIPELVQPYSKERYEEQFRESARSLVLLAYEDDRPVGFKLGYERSADGSFYSWMGGVAQSHRQAGAAGLLLQFMEDWCRDKGYESLRFKTRNTHVAMLRFALKNGFQIIGFEPAATVDQHRIWLEKPL